MNRISILCVLMNHTNVLITDIETQTHHTNLSEWDISGYRKVRVKWCRSANLSYFIFIIQFTVL